MTGAAMLTVLLLTGLYGVVLLVLGLGGVRVPVLVLVALFLLPLAGPAAGALSAFRCWRPPSGVSAVGGGPCWARSGSARWSGCWPSGST